MSLSMKSQRYIYKIHSDRLKKEEWQLALTPNEARDTGELISLSENQLIRFIDELNEIPDCESQIQEVRKQIGECRKDTACSQQKRKLKSLYTRLLNLQFKADYVCVVMDSITDYRKLARDGFTLSGIAYCRLLGTVNGVKSNTIVFVSRRLYPELRRRIDNGRSPAKEFTPAKLEAYCSLVCSSSVPVSSPRGIIVVPDCITRFHAEVITLDDTDRDEPELRHIPSKEMELRESDGYGLAMPALMSRWGREIGKDYLLPACVIRNSFCKGAVFPVDFQQFARENNRYTVQDIWGVSHDIRDVELILTESMLKLWDSYSSMDEYLENCRQNHYQFAITKVSESELEHERRTNYQFLQSYQFTDSELSELIRPTVEEIKDILCGNYQKAILYAKGTHLTKDNIKLGHTFADALMIEPEMQNDPFVKKQLHSMLQKRMDEAKTGALNIPANYSFVSGDPYSLCQSIFGMEITGLLQAGQVYSRFWSERGVTEISSFRAPMTSHNNIRRLQVVHNDKMDDFYRYMTTPTIFNSWDTCADAMNGFDKDGDCVMNTSLPLLVKHTRELPAIVCVQRKAKKCVPSETDLVQSNIDSFGNAIGEITNQITGMFEQQSHYEPGSDSYEELDYRIKCGQLYQQNAIDKTKGIDAKPMPKSWSSKKKPYFMRYIYPAENTKYKNYLKKNDEKCLMLFRTTVEELISHDIHTPEEKTFIEHFYRFLPLGTGPCTINRICRHVEEAFDNLPKIKSGTFDYSILKSSKEYPRPVFLKIKKHYEAYRRELSAFAQLAARERIRAEEKQKQKELLREAFRHLCVLDCPDEEILCNIVLDLCYPGNGSKQFAWDMCGSQIIQNLLHKNGGTVHVPVRSPDGDIYFRGEHFHMETIKLGGIII